MPGPHGQTHVHRTGALRIALAAYLACIGLFCFALVFGSFTEGSTEKAEKMPLFAEIWVGCPRMGSP